MATITSEKSGNWSATTTWAGGVVPGNGDTVVIAETHLVLYDADQSGFVNGLAGLVINGILHFSSSGSYLKMNGNITGTGKLYVGNLIWLSSGLTLVNGMEKTYVKSMSSPTIAVMDTISSEELVEKQSIEEVELNSNSFYFDAVNMKLYLHLTNEIDPTMNSMYLKRIMRPPIGVESTTTLLFNSTGTINVPTIRMYGWYPEREYTQLSADASAEQNQIILKEDMELQQGDIVIIGCGTIYGELNETAKGVYTVSSYDNTSKTVTLTVNLQTARLKDDYVAWVSRPIKITRTSGTASLFSNASNYDNCVFIGMSHTISISSSFPLTGKANKFWIAKHCSSRDGRQFVSFVDHVLIEECTSMEKYNASPGYSCSGVIQNCIGFTVGAGMGGSAICRNNILQNIGGGVDWVRSVDGDIIKNITSIPQMIPGGCMSNSEIWIKKNILTTNNAYPYPYRYINCTFHDPYNLGFNATANFKFNNCIFDSEADTLFTFVTPSFGFANVLIESFDHNQLSGNYKAWCKGGRIETDFYEDTVLPGRLIFNCESADYPVFKDFPVTLPAYRSVWWYASTMKDFSGGEVKMELIDPTADPLIDPSASPLKSYTLPDNPDELKSLKLSYRSNKNMQAILRISAKNASGTVEVNTRLIERRIKYGR